MLKRVPGKSLLKKWWFDGWHLPPGIFRCQQVYILKTTVIFGEYLKVLKIFGKKNPTFSKNQKKNTHFLGKKLLFSSFFVIIYVIFYDIMLLSVVLNILSRVLLYIIIIFIIIIILFLILYYDTRTYSII